MREMIETVKSIAYGHAVADALGVPVEFSSRQERKNDPVSDMRGYGTHPVPAGTWSDDTSMAIATLDSLAGGVDLDDMMQKFCLWKTEAAYAATNEVFDMGIATGEALFRYLKGTPALQCGCDGEYDNGNGSLMRIYPAVLYWHYADFPDRSDDALDEFIFQVSALTHSHLRSQLACGIYAHVLLHLLEGKSVTDGLRHAQAHYSQIPAYQAEIKHFRRLFDAGFAALPEDELQSSGYVVTSLEAAVWCLLNTDSYAECVLKAVNLGSDTDTVAAIAGALAGYKYGMEGIPQSWLGTLLRTELLDEICERFTASYLRSPPVRNHLNRRN